MYFIGAITGSSGGYSNQQTGASGIGTFAIPASTRAFYLVPSASGLLFELSATTGMTGAGFQTSLARGAQLSGPGVINGPYRAAFGTQAVVSIFHNQAGFISCRVYVSP